MHVLLRDINKVNILAFIVLISIVFIYNYYKIKDYVLSIQGDKVSGVKIKRPGLTKKSLKDLNDEINELDEQLSQLNNDFLSGDKVANANFDDRLNTIKKKYLELYLRTESFLSQKEQLKKQKINVKKIKAYKEKIEELKVIIDLLLEEKNTREQEGQGKSLRILTIVETIFLPLGVITGYFGMNFQSMGNDLGDNPTGIFSLKYGQLFVFALMFVSIALILLGFKFLFSKPETFGTMNDFNKLQQHYDELLNPQQFQNTIAPWQKHNLELNHFL